MTWLALAALVGWALSMAAFASLLRSVLRSDARERELLVNQLLHAVNKPWQLPPPLPPEPDYRQLLVEPDDEEEFVDVDQLAS